MNSLEYHAEALSSDALDLLNECLALLTLLTLLTLPVLIILFVLLLLFLLLLLGRRCTPRYG